MKSTNRKTSGGASQEHCGLCGKAKTNMMPVALIRPPVVAEIRKVHPDFSTEGAVCAEDLNHFRSLYIQCLLTDERGELSEIDRDVLESMQQHELLSGDPGAAFGENLSFGEALSDRIAAFGGSWKFIIVFVSVMAVWIGVNALVLLWKPFDPYPFILLNLLLSCLAALQAPVIMMSQNRQEAKDRLRGEHDYRVNLKAELAIRHLNEKIDHLLSRQWERLVEIQQVQMELMEDILELKAKKP